MTDLQGKPGSGAALALNAVVDLILAYGLEWSVTQGRKLLGDKDIREPSNHGASDGRSGRSDEHPRTQTACVSMEPECTLKRASWRTASPATQGQRPFATI